MRRSITKTRCSLRSNIRVLNHLSMKSGLPQPVPFSFSPFPIQLTLVAFIQLRRYPERSVRRSCNVPARIEPPNALALCYSGRLDTLSKVRT